MSKIEYTVVPEVRFVVRAETYDGDKITAKNIGEFTDQARANEIAESLAFRDGARWHPLKEYAVSCGDFTLRDDVVQSPQKPESKLKLVEPD